MIKCLLQVTGKAKINENRRVEVLAADEEEEEDQSRCLLQEEAKVHQNLLMKGKKLLTSLLKERKNQRQVQVLLRQKQKKHLGLVHLFQKQRIHRDLQRNKRQM